MTFSMRVNLLLHMDRPSGRRNPGQREARYQALYGRHQGLPPHGRAQHHGRLSDEGVSNQESPKAPKVGSGSRLGAAEKNQTAPDCRCGRLQKTQRTSVRATT